MSATSTTLGEFIAADLIAAKAAGQQFPRAALAARIDVLHEQWTAFQTPAEPVKIDAEAIYQAYPRHQGKKAAMKAIAAALKDINGNPSWSQLGHLSAADYLHNRVTLFASAVATWPAKDRQFRPMAATWFNQGRYLDDPREWQIEGTRSTTDDKPRDYSHV